MSSSVGTKAKKKQPSSLDKKALASTGRGFETALLSLENACFAVIDNQFADGNQDVEGLYWQQRFINVANPVSLALMEYKGPRHFHNHYRHRPEDEAILHPVLENPVDMLAQVCRDALNQSQSQLVGIQDPDMIKARRMLEGALHNFLVHYNGSKTSKH